MIREIGWICQVLACNQGSCRDKNSENKPQTTSHLYKNIFLTSFQVGNFFTRICICNINKYFANILSLGNDCQWRDKYKKHGRCSSCNSRRGSDRHATMISQWLCYIANTHGTIRSMTQLSSSAFAGLSTCPVLRGSTRRLRGLLLGNGSMIRA